MAKPIKSTPTLKGKDAERFVKRMKETEKRPITKKEKKLARDIRKNSKFFEPESKTTYTGTKIIKKDLNIPTGFAENGPEILGYVMHDGIIEITNPCSIPIEIMESNIKQYKKNPPKKGEISFFGCILIKLPFKNKRGKRK